MRITLDLDDDVVLAAKQLAAASKQSLGKVISEVFRRGVLADERSAATRHPRTDVAVGFEVLPASGRVVTKGRVRKLCDENEVD